MGIRNRIGDCNLGMGFVIIDWDLEFGIKIDGLGFDIEIVDWGSGLRIGLGVRDLD